MTERVRWRMTLDELIYVTKTTPHELNIWAARGALGDKYIMMHTASGSRWRHITREMAQRAVVMSRLRRAGVELESAAQVARTHKAGDCTDLIVKIGKGVEVHVSREDLP